MEQKNSLILQKDKNGETVVILPYTSSRNVSGLKELIQKKLEQFLAKIKTIFVEKETGKGLSSNDFEDKYKSQLDNLKTENVTTITVNGKVLEAVDGNVSLTTETVAPTISSSEVEKMFGSTEA